MKLLYEGKAKQLFQCENNEEIYIHYKNNLYVFSWELSTINTYSLIFYRYYICNFYIVV